ncbi:MAG: biopolymer transporter ExbD [Steroidobacteraceae bacterium]|nr:biopolymer transporter ExbD [Steroidobacteraceae bacterium]
MTPYRIKRHRKRLHGGSHYALVPFIDMMTILVVFLLAHTADVDLLPNTRSIPIPQSLSQQPPHPSVVVMVTSRSIYVDGRLVGRIGDLVAGPDPVIEPLKAALSAPDDGTLIATAKQAPAKREVTIMGDKHMPYSVLKKIMMSCSAADYDKVSLAVVQRERAQPQGAAT